MQICRQNLLFFPAKTVSQYLCSEEITNVNLLKIQCDILGKYAYLLSCQELGEKINTTHIYTFNIKLPAFGYLSIKTGNRREQLV